MQCTVSGGQWLAGILVTLLLVTGQIHSKHHGPNRFDEELREIFESDESLDNAKKSLHAKDILKDNDIKVIENILLKLIEEKRNNERKGAGIRDSGDTDYGSSAGARAWLDGINDELAERLGHEALMGYRYLTNLTDYNAQAAANTSIEVANWLQPIVETARLYYEHRDELGEDVQRELMRLIYGRTVPLSANKDVTAAVNHISTDMEGIYGAAKAPVEEGGEPKPLTPDLEDVMSDMSASYEQKQLVWEGWRTATGPQLKDKFSEMVENMNIAAIENGMSDVGEAWRRCDYDYPDIENSILDIWEEVKPLYMQLHAYVRRKLIERYPDNNLSETEPIPAHLLGNMWAQQWDNTIELMKPDPSAAESDVTNAMKAQDYTPLKMFQMADEFFKSIDLSPMTDIFWEKSMIVKPEDGREVVCHASAEDFLKEGDFRIKMCTQVNGGDFETIHHEMGHIEYFMQYAGQKTVHREGANAAFHEAVGDAIALSVNTPVHMYRIGLLDTEPDTSDTVTGAGLNFLMQEALKKIAFLPFGYVVDKWRLQVFDGTVSADDYNEGWWKLREKYQGIKAPVERTENDFDPGAKYHVAANVPYWRYVGAHILQFQFHKAMCDAAGHTGPLFQCDIYNSTAAGDILKDMLSLGSSKPWEDALYGMTGTRKMDPSAILEYFQPLREWLEIQNDGHHVGWE